jgi:hypothetical protein
MKTIHKTCKNLLIPCSGPGTRSAGYTKFHKTLNRVGPYAVIDHIIASYTDIDWTPELVQEIQQDQQDILKEKRKSL